MKEVGDPQRYIHNCVNMAREMVQQHRNRPSIVLWGIAGEVDAPEDVIYQVTKSTVDAYREQDPTRLVTMHCPRGQDIEGLVHVIGTDLVRSDEDHENNPGRCYMVSEFSVSFSGRGRHDGEPFNEEDSNLAHEEHLRGVNQRKWLAGCAIWNQFDWNGETYDHVYPHVTCFGMCDVWRFPKDVYFFYKSQWNPAPMIHICGHWTWPHGEGRMREVKVYSNADEVELFLNDLSLGKTVKGTDAGLQHPPFLWTIPFCPGELKAVGTFKNGGEVADIRKTAGEPFAVQLSAHPEGLVAGDPESYVYIAASIVDRQGTVVPNACVPVSFTNYGCGKLLPQTWLEYGTGLTWRTVAGLTRVALKATEFGGRAVVSAISPGLIMGRVIIPCEDPKGRRNPFKFWRDAETGLDEPAPSL